MTTSECGWCYGVNDGPGASLLLCLQFCLWAVDGPSRQLNGSRSSMHLNFLRLRPPWRCFPSPCFHSLSHTPSPLTVLYLFSSFSDTLLPLFHYSLPSFCPMSPFHLLYIHFPPDYIPFSHTSCISIPSSSIFLSCDLETKSAGQRWQEFILSWQN